MTIKAAQIFLLHLILTTRARAEPFDSRKEDYESCNSQWIFFNTEGLRADLESKLIGQHIAPQIIMRAVKGFMSDDNPEKPLVLSLYGPTGTGKNLVTKLIAENIYKMGMNSSFVHYFVSAFHFPHHNHIDTYKTQLQQWIKGNVAICEHSMYIFDDIDQMPLDLIDSIMPYLDYYDNLDGVSYRKAIFILLSNVGGKIISQITLDFWKLGKSRKEIRLKHLKPSICESACMMDSMHSKLFDENLVDFFVPFLPLEYQHVILCAVAEMKARGIQPDRGVAESLAKDLHYFPKSDKVFSIRGCRIGARLAYYI